MNINSKNIVLVGMPAVGKSTAGVLLAKRIGRYFLDTDVFIQAVSGRSLQEIIDTDGLEEFCRIEAEYVSCIDKTDCVIATGGSVIYSSSAMNHLKSSGVIVHLDLPLADIKTRLSNLDVRGVVMASGQSIDDLYYRRDVLYRKWSDITVDCTGLSHEELVDRIVSKVNL